MAAAVASGQNTLQHWPKSTSDEDRFLSERKECYATVKAVGMELCPALGISIPVGKDSMSMKTVWNDNGEDKAVTSPISLVVTAFANTTDARKTLTPLLRTDLGETKLILIDLGNGKNRMGGSSLAQVYGQIGDSAPDVDNTSQLTTFFAEIQR